MKLFAIILSIFTITLSVMPCDDEVDINSEEISIMNADSHNENHGLADLCTPFCSCVCCATVVIQPTFIHETLLSEMVYSELNSTYMFSFSSDFLNRIFQPPQV